jgi:hypothetical protein
MYNGGKWHYSFSPKTIMDSISFRFRDFEDLFGDVNTARGNVYGAQDSLRNPRMGAFAS